MTLNHDWSMQIALFCHEIFTTQQAINYLLLIAACAAASLAIGTRNGEHDT